MFLWVEVFNKKKNVKSSAIANEFIGTIIEKGVVTYLLVFHKVLLFYMLLIYFQLFAVLHLQQIT